MRDRAILTIVLSMFLAKLVSGADFPRDDTVKWTKWSKAREKVDLGHGPLIDDLESYVFDDKFTRAVRNKKDPGNWVHELTHRVQAMLRGQMKIRTGIQHNSFYVFNGYAFSVPEPNVTLLQVAAEVSKEDQGPEYKHYLKFAAAWRNNEPLFVLDEATAYANCVLYQLSVGIPDQLRATTMLEFLPYTDAVISAVEKHDTEYEQLEQLKAYVAWHRKRAEHLGNLHRYLFMEKLYKLW